MTVSLSMLEQDVDVRSFIRFENKDFFQRADQFVYASVNSSLLLQLLSLRLLQIIRKKKINPPDLCQFSIMKIHTIL